MKNKFFPVFFAVLVLSALFVVPAFAQSPEPPAVPAPVFDWGVISDALSAILIALIVPLAGFVARWLISQADYQKSLLSEKQQLAFDLAVNVFIYAAEQMKIKGFINDKLTYVIERSEAWLMERGIEMEINELRARIEAAVIQEFPKNKLTE